MKVFVSLVVLFAASSLCGQDVQNADDSVDTSAALAEIQALKHAKQELDQSTPDADTMRVVRERNRRQQLDEQSKTDLDIFKEKAPDIVGDFASGGLDAAAGVAESLVGATADAFNAGLDAYTPSNIGGPSKSDVGLWLTPDEQQRQQNADDQLQQQLSAQRQFEEALGAVLNRAFLYKPRVPAPGEVQQGLSPSWQADPAGQGYSPSVTAGPGTSSIPPVRAAPQPPPAAAVGSPPPNTCDPQRKGWCH
jgi:hypothetical protein